MFKLILAIIAAIGLAGCSTYSGVCLTVQGQGIKVSKATLFYRGAGLFLTSTEGTLVTVPGACTLVKDTN